MHRMFTTIGIIYVETEFGNIKKEIFMTLDRKISEKIPPGSYKQDREETGRLTLTEKAEDRAIYKGVQYCKCRYLRGNGESVWVYLITVLPDAPAKLAVSAASLGTVKMVKRHASEFDGYVICAMNAGYFHFFNNGDLTPYGIQVVHGEEMFPPGKDKPEYSNNWVGFSKQGQIVFGNAEDYDKYWRHKLEYAVGGGMRLIQNGEICLWEDSRKAPRTTIGIADDGTLILMCADGRSPLSAGLTYGDVIDVYTGLGYRIKELLNLDGGGSTTLVMRTDNGDFAVENIPSGPPLPVSYPKYDLPKPQPCGDSQARAVADCILIVATDQS